jgi:hypothetical protein
MGNRKRALSLVVVAAIIGLAVPLASFAAIAVVPPAGNVDPAVMDQLQVALETVAADTATEVDGVFWLSAEPSGEELAIAVGLSSSDGKEIARESRVASRASAAAQVRAMARAMIRAAASPRPAVVTISEESKKVPPPKPVRPVLNSPYDQRRAFWISAGPTLGGLALGGAMIGLSFVDGINVPALAIGASIAGMSFLVGPSLGHFIVGNNLQGSLTLVFRTLLSAGATAFFIGGFFVDAFSSDPCGFMGCSEEEYEEGVDKQEHSDSGATGFFVGGALTATVAVALMIVDLATVRRAAQRANEKAAAAKEPEPKISNVSFAPMLVPGPHGSKTAGLAFSMRF